ncbi:MAG: metal ABC transporter permease [Solirubrobacterales bacterium]|nr:metal ABC transporter permease [Solirubrobacterales bacterium]
MISLFEPFELPFMQRAALEIVLLAPIAALIGTQIALRGLAFFAHGAGAATFPGLVVAGPAGIPAALAGLATALGFAVAAGRRGRRSQDVPTALALVAALAIGIVLASDVFGSGSEVDQLLFGSLLAIGDAELLTSAVVAGVCALAALGLHRAWLVGGFDPGAERPLGVPGRGAELALYGCIAIAVVAAVDAVGALLVSAILVVPAVTALPLARSVRRLQLIAGLIALSEGLAGMLIAFHLDAPPGATIAVLSGLGFALVVVAPALLASHARGGG